MFVRVSINGGADVAVLAAILLSSNEAVAVVLKSRRSYIAEVLEEEEAKQLEPEPDLSQDTSLVQSHNFKR